MPTKNPRVNVTLSKRTYDVIKSISDTSGKPMSGFIAEMLDAAIPTLERMAVTFQAIKTAQSVEQDKFLASMDRAQAALEPVVMEAVGQFDLFLAQVDSAIADGGAPACGEEPAAVANPRPVTRGSTPLTREKQLAVKPVRKPSNRAASSRKS